MKILQITLLLIIITGCSPIKKLSLSHFQKSIEGKIVDKDGEPFIGLTISEYFNKNNSVISNLDGHFKIEISNYPYIIISGFYNPIYIKIQGNNKNFISLNKNLKKKSNAILKEIQNLRYTIANINLSGKWIIESYSLIENEEWKYLNKIDSIGLSQRLEKQIPFKVSKNKIISFESNSKTCIIDGMKLNYSLSDSNLFLSQNDVVYTFKQSISSTKPLSIRLYKNSHLGEISITLKKKR